MDGVLMVDVDKCTGCKICELVCSANQHGEYNPSRSCITVLRNMEMDLNLPALSPECRHQAGCSKCVEFCPTKCLNFTPLKEAALIRKRTKIGMIPSPMLSKLI